MEPAQTLGDLLRCHRKNAGLTQTALAEKLNYHHTLISRIEKGERLPNDDFIETFIATLQIIDEESQQLRRWHQQATSIEVLDEPRFSPPNDDNLTWSRWRDLCWEISRQQMAAGRHKYWPELYLARDAVEQRFEEFLASEEICLAVIGKSGVGKSNFLLATAESLYRTRQDAGVLLYNGAALPTGVPLADTIARDIAHQGKFPAQQTEVIWTLLNHAARDADAFFVLCLDALNENPQPWKILQSLEQLAGQDRPRLKVVITSRPETWRSLKNSHRYPAAQFSEVHLAPFSLAELPQAYRKYRRVFNLQSAYADLSPQIQTMLCDPLNLLLLADIYSGRAIPRSLPPLKLIREYLQALTRTHRLQSDDLTWLHDELMPLLISRDHCQNTISITYLAPGDACDALHPSLIRLLNAGVLSREGAGPTEKIVFTHERFYEYFAARRIGHLLDTAADRNEAFWKFVTRLPEQLYLWGALQTLLVEALRREQTDLVELIADRPLPLVEELLVTTLMARGQEDPASVEQLVYSLARYRFPRIRKTALVLAGRLDIPAILIQGGHDVDREVRLAAAYAAYLLWQQQPALGQNILDAWANETGWRFGWPPFRADIEAAGVLSILMLSLPRQTRTQRESTRQNVRNAWRTILARLLWIAPQRKNNPVLGVYRRVLVVIIRQKLQAGIGDSNVGQLLNRIFPLPPERRATFRALLNCFDQSYDEIVAQEDLLVEVMRWNELHHFYIIAMLLILKLPRDGDQGFSFLQRLFHRTLSVDQPLLCSGSLITVLYTIVRRGPEPPNNITFALYRTMAKECFDKTWGLYRNHTGKLAYHFGLDLFSAVAWQKYHNPQPELLIYALEETIASKHSQTALILEGLLKDTIQLSNLVGHPHLALEAMTVLLEHADIWRDDARLRNRIINCLGEIRLYAPQEVDALLSLHKIPEATQSLIRAREGAEETWQRTFFPKVPLLLASLIPQPGIRRSVVKILQAVPTCDNYPQWFKISLNEIINSIYGERIV